MIERLCFKTLPHPPTLFDINPFTPEPPVRIHRAQNNGRSTDNVWPDRGLDQSNSRLAGHFDWSFLDACHLMRFAL